MFKDHNLTVIFWILQFLLIFLQAFGFINIHWLIIVSPIIFWLIIIFLVITIMAINYRDSNSLVRKICESSVSELENIRFDEPIKQNIILNCGLNEISKRHYAWLEQMGLLGNTTVLEQLALITSDIGKCVNECRDGIPTDKLKYELADLILRVLCVAETQNIDIENVINEKLVMNATYGSIDRKK